MSIKQRILAGFTLLALLFFTACSITPETQQTQKKEHVPVRVAALKGPTGMGLSKLIVDQKTGQTRNDYTFTLTGTPDDMVAKVSSGAVDIAALPTNMASILYHKTDKKIRMLAINTLGVLYVLESGDTIHKIEDLVGRELLATGQGAVPEYAINELLKQADLETSVKVTYKTEHEELATLAASGQADLVLLPEPFVTTVLNQNPGMRIALDLTEVWKTVHDGENGSELAMGCMVVNSAFAEQNPEAVQIFLEEYQSSVDAVNEDPETAGAWIAEQGILPNADLAKQAIPNCYIVLIHSDKMRDVLEPFYQILFDANKQSIGGQLPDPDFYYIP
jgi:NitT/TauT family transport system substrate-binding protein